MASAASVSQVPMPALAPTVTAALKYTIVKIADSFEAPSVLA